MDSGISGIDSRTQVDLSTQVQDTSSSQVANRTQIELNQGVTFRTPPQVHHNAQQTLVDTDLTILQTNTNGVQTDQTIIQAVEERNRGGLPEAIAITVPPGNTAIDLDSRVFAKEIMSLPEGQDRQWGIDNAQKLMQECINNGHKVYQSIFDPDTPNADPSKQNIRDLMYYLTAMGCEKNGGYFEQGAFNLPDPGQKLRSWLDGCTDEVYQRKSTHIKEFMDDPSCRHRGIDMKLPHGLGTLLYGSMGHGVHGTNGDRIFLKMEDHGCRISGLTNRDPEGPRDRPLRFFSDLIKSIKHGWGGLLTKLGLQPTAGTRKERVPSDLTRQFKALVSTAKQYGLDNVLNEDNPATKETGKGIRIIYRNLEAMLENSRLQQFMSSDPVARQFHNDLDAFKVGLELREGFDHLEHRIGNEIVFDENEMGIPEDPRKV